MSLTKPQVVAHRGASALAPELTPAAFELALRLGVNFIELDVRMSRDGRIVVIHDKLVNRTTDGRGAVKDKSLDQLKELDAGSWFNRAFPSLARSEFASQRIPTLEEAIELVSAGPVGLYVELKDPDIYQPEFESKILAILRQKRFTNRATLLCFNHDSLQRVRALAPDARIGLLVDDLSIDPIATAQALRADEIAIRHSLLSAELATRTRTASLELSVWTADTARELQRMIEAGVDRIITNRPDHLLQLLEGTDNR